MARETYPCRAWCGLGSAQPAEDQRRAFRCALPGFDEQTWDDGSQSPRPYMGRLPIYGEPDPDEPAQDDPMHPRDDHRDGCPGAWYRCAFVTSLEKYERLLTEHGFASNLRADRVTDRLVLDALQFIEAERIRARAHAQTIQYQHEQRGK